MYRAEMHNSHWGQGHSDQTHPTTCHGYYGLIYSTTANREMAEPSDPPSPHS